MSAPDDDTRPVSVAELLARNGTIGSPPVGGRRRRRGRRNSDGVSVAELTGEIPVVPAEEAVYAEPVYQEAVADETVYAETVYEDVTYEDVTYEDVTYGETVYEDVTYEEVSYGETVYEDVTYEEVSYGETAYGEVTYGEVTYEEATDEATGYAEAVYAEAVYAEPVYEEAVAEEAVYEEAVYAEAVYTEAVYTEAVAEVEQIEPAPLIAPPLSGDPQPRRGDGPELSDDPRPLRRSSGAEQMAYDPVEESVNLADLVDQPAGEVEELRSYLRGSTDTLFSGGTVADDLARRGIAADTDEDVGEYISADPAASSAVPGPPRGVTGTLLGSAAAVLQSLLAVAFGAGLFIAFDQLWRWNNLVALILAVLVVLTLAAAVRFVRKTEDIVSTLTAVAVGLLVTLGPLALQST
jgi:hypothetical protein